MIMYVVLLEIVTLGGICVPLFSLYRHSFGISSEVAITLSFRPARRIYKKK